MPTLADAKLGGARLDEGFYCATYTALVTTSEVTLSHRDDFRPRPMSRRNRRYRLPSGPRHPYGFDADIADNSDVTPSHRERLSTPTEHGATGAYQLPSPNIAAITEEFFAAALTPRRE